MLKITPEEYDRLISTCNKDSVFIFYKLSEHALYPTKATVHSAGIDIYASEETIIPTNKCVAVKTDITCFIPKGYELQIRPRSGLCLKNIITIFGTVDADYSGMHICVMIMNNNSVDYVINKHTRVAQGIFSKLYDNKILDSNLQIICDSEIIRSGGFGSTGY